MSVVKLQSVEAGGAEVKGPDDAIQELQTEQVSLQDKLRKADSMTEIREAMDTASGQAREAGKDLAVQRIVENYFKKNPDNVDGTFESQFTGIDADWNKLESLQYDTNGFGFDVDAISTQDIKALKGYGVTIDDLETAMIKYIPTQVATNDRNNRMAQEDIAMNSGSVSNARQLVNEDTVMNQGRLKPDRNGIMNSRFAGRKGGEADKQFVENQRKETIKGEDVAMNQGELLPTQTLTEMANLIMKERGVTPENALALQKIANSFPSNVIQRILAKSGGTSFEEDGIVGPQTRALNQYVLNRSIPKEQMQALIGKDALAEDGINGRNTNKILAHLKTIDETTANQYASNLNSNMSQFTA